MFDVLISDGDEVEKKNLRNQLFTDDDATEKLKKVVALADRYGGHYNVDAKRVTEYVTSQDMLRCFSHRPIMAGKSSRSWLVWWITTGLGS